MGWDAFSTWVIIVGGVTAVLTAFICLFRKSQSFGEGDDGTEWKEALTSFLGTQGYYPEYVDKQLCKPVDHLEQVCVHPHPAPKCDTDKAIN